MSDILQSVSGSRLITVVIPAFNASRFIERTLVSVRQQSHKDLDILVINDGSTDDTVSIVKRIQHLDDRVRLLSKENGGLSSARNHGLFHAKGQYVAFLDADDLWHPSKLAKQLAAFEQPSDVAVGAVYTLYRAIDTEDRLIEDHYRWNIHGSVLARHLVYNFIGAGGSSLMCRRDLGLALGGFDVRYQGANGGFCEDYDFQLKLASSYGIALVPEYLVGYRKHPTSMSTNRLRNFHSHKAVVEHHIAQHPEISNECVSMARGSICVMHIKVLLKSRRYINAAREALALLALDPLRFAVECVWRVPVDVVSALIGLVNSRVDRSRNNVLFDDLDPAFANPRRHLPLTSTRLKVLARDDTRRISRLKHSEIRRVTSPE
jgi:glycosyltransferase involved in cell wall biosynthesis